MCNESLGQCVSIPRCSDAIEFNDGSKMFQVRFGDDEEEVESCHYLETCCDPENIIESIPDDPSLGHGPDGGNGFDTGNHVTGNPVHKPGIRTPPPYPGGDINESSSDEEVTTGESASDEEVTTGKSPSYEGVPVTTEESLTDNRNEDDPEANPSTKSPGVHMATVGHVPSIPTVSQGGSSAPGTHNPSISDHVSQLSLKCAQNLKIQNS